MQEKGFWKSRRECGTLAEGPFQKILPGSLGAGSAMPYTAGHLGVRAWLLAPRGLAWFKMARLQGLSVKQGTLSPKAP